MMFVVAAISILLTMSLALIRAMLGPTVFDRVLALNMFGTKTVLLICVVCFLTDRTDFLDLALLYSLPGSSTPAAPPQSQPHVSPPTPAPSSSPLPRARTPCLRSPASTHASFPSPTPTSSL